MSIAALGLGATGYLMYTYSKNHPIKTKMAVNKVKNMMKDSI